MKNKTIDDRPSARRAPAAKIKQDSLGYIWDTLFLLWLSLFPVFHLFYNFRVCRNRLKLEEKPLYQHVIRIC